MTSKLFLSTTAIDEFWDKSKRIVFLGDWCKLYNKKHVSEEVDYATIPFHWNSTEKTEKGILYCQAILEKFYPALTEKLNNYHGLNESDRFYKLLLGTWPFHFIHQLYDKYLHLKKAKTMYPEIGTWCLDSEQYYIPLDYLDYCNVSLYHGDDRYQLQIYSELIQEMGFPAPIRRLKFPLIQKKSYKSERKKLSSRNAFRILTGAFAKKEAICISDVSLSVRNFISLWVKLRRNIYLNDFNLNLDVNMNVDSVFRSEINIGLDGDEFERLLSSIAMKHIPLIFLEGLNKITEQVLSKTCKSPTALLTMQLGNNTARNVYLANKFEEIGIYGLQHGGGYGVDRLNPHELYERDVCDLFFTAGWSNGRKTLPLSNIKFLSRNLKNPKAKDILFCLNDLPRYVYRLHFVPMGTTYNRAYLAEVVLFANQLKNNKKLVLRLFPDPEKFGNLTDERIRSRFPDVRFDDGNRSFLEALSMSRIYVSNYFNTTFLEAIANNYPCIAFLNHNIFSFSDTSLPYIEKLYDVGILQKSPVAAANFVDEIYDDVDFWWQSESVQKTRALFVKKYAHCSKYWAEEWKDTFKLLMKKR